MRVVHDRIEGPVRVTDELKLHGMISGDTTVSSGGLLILHGMCCRDLIVEAGGAVQLNGMVVGNAYNRGGSLSVFGMIIGFLSTEAGDTKVDPRAVVQGGFKP